MTEAQLKSLCMGLGVQNGWAVHATAQAKPRRPVRKISGGFPDLTFARDKELVFMEIKDEHGYPTAEQWGWGAALPAWYVVRPSDWESGRVAEILA